MNQFQWTFLDNAARRHTLGIAHGARSGNLVVHCNAQIVKIDFSVLEPRTYSFFVEEELCHLAIEGTKEDGFQYNFHIDTEVDTPVNRERNLRKISSRRHGWLAVLALVLFVGGLIGAVCYVGWSGKQASLQRELYVTGVPASAKLLPNGNFEFIGGNRVVSDEALPADAARIQALRLGALEEVPIRYYRLDSDKFVVDWRALFGELEANDHSGTVDKVLDGLGASLPTAAGTPLCALQAAGRLGSFRNQLSLIDTYAVGEKEDAERWAATLKTQAYQQALISVCIVESE